MPSSITDGDRPYFTGKLQGTADYLLPDSLLHKLGSNVATKNLPTSCYTGIGPLLKVCWPHLVAGRIIKKKSCRRRLKALVDFLRKERRGASQGASQ